MTSGRRSSSAEGSPAGTAPGKPGNCGAVAAAAEGYRPSRISSARIASLASQLELAQDVAIAPDAGARHEHILLIADADAHAVVGQSHELLAGTNGLACRLDLQPGLGGEEPALGHERRNRLPRVLEVRLRRRGLRGARRPAVAHAAPEVELPGGGEDAALDARAVAGQLAAAAREDIGRRLQLRPGKFRVEQRLLDARGADAQIGVVSDAPRRPPRPADRRWNAASQLSATAPAPAPAPSTARAAAARAAPAP